MTNQAGAITFARTYDPYGVVTATSRASQTEYGFTGESYDTYIKLIYLRSRWYDPASGRFPTKDSWQGDYNRPLSLNRWMYVEGNPVNYTDPSGHLSISQIMSGLGVTTVDQVASLFRPGGALQGKWGYLAFLDAMGGGISRGKLWKETGHDYENWQSGKSLIFRSNIPAHPCNVNYTISGANGTCFTEGYAITTGKFTANYPFVWRDENSSGQLSLLELGLLDVDWYIGPSEPEDSFYAYQWYPVQRGYDWNKADKLSLSSNLAGLLSPCVLTCPEGGPICLIGAVSTLWNFVGGTISTTADANKVSSGDLNSIGNLALDTCSSLPLVGWGCSYSGFWSGLESGNVYIEP